MPDNTQKIQELESILDAGAKRTSVDGTSTEFDEKSIRKRIAELKDTDTSGNYDSLVRPVTLRINLS